MTFRLGCAVWAYKDWIGELFPPGSRATDFLPLYSRRFTSVEGNTTFYSIPDPATVQRWAAATPAGFKFCPKLPRSLTHQGALAPMLPQTRDFLQRMQGLGDRLGCVFAQLPPRYSPAALEDLSQFLVGFPHPEVALGIEVRHLDWFQPIHAERLNQLLARFGVARVLLDTRPIYECEDDPQRESERRKPRVPLQPVVTAPFTVIRYISHPDRQLNQPYLNGWASQVQTWLQQGQEIYFFVHCPIESHSPGTARWFQHQLEQQFIPVPPLPWDSVDPPTSQLSLF
ncbi:MAG: DUF72 domain-containing protein [Elainella sp. Prado103]|jgi:uncharacterized protein YecE (DUF72 family)|nr:DUF72 domain-containing protein [Elainella sp. Prado103]